MPRPTSSTPGPAATGRRRWLALAALAALPAAALPGPLRRPWPAGRATPGLALPTLDGSAWTLAAHRGRVVALNFWASWCEPCRDEMPSLAQLAQRHALDGLVVVAVNHREGVATIRAFTERIPVGLPIVRDADGQAAKAFEARVLPTTVVVGRDGRAAFSVIGEADWSADPVRLWVAAML
jgi:thiol-disulfide isomerase/thioredoxin